MYTRASLPSCRRLWDDEDGWVGRRQTDRLIDCIHLGAFRHLDDYLKGECTIRRNDTGRKLGRLKVTERRGPLLNWEKQKWQKLLRMIRIKWMKLGGTLKFWEEKMLTERQDKICTQKMNRLKEAIDLHLMGNSCFCSKHQANSLSYLTRPHCSLFPYSLARPTTCFVSKSPVIVSVRSWHIFQW